MADQEMSEGPNYELAFRISRDNALVLASIVIEQQSIIAMCKPVLEAVIDLEYGIGYKRATEALQAIKKYEEEE